MEARLFKFINENEKDLKHYGMLRRYEDSKVFLKANNHLVCEETANFLVIWCINLEMEEVSIYLAILCYEHDSMGSENTSAREMGFIFERHILFAVQVKFI